MAEPRLAATFFIQPSLDATLCAFSAAGTNTQTNPPFTFGAWKEQKYSRYYGKNEKSDEA
jgi:hypothetical protein